MSSTVLVRRFVRETLGCGCADEVFASIEREIHILPDGTRSVRLVNGDRLLVWAIGPLTAAMLAQSDR